MNLILPFAGLIIGFLLGSLGATVAHLRKEIEQAELDGHRR